MIKNNVSILFMGVLDEKILLKKKCYVAIN